MMDYKRLQSELAKGMSKGMAKVSYLKTFAVRIPKVKLTKILGREVKEEKKEENETIQDGGYKLMEDPEELDNDIYVAMEDETEGYWQ